jgi:hypothetical protein
VQTALFTLLWYCSHDTAHPRGTVYVALFISLPAMFISPSVLCPVRSPCRTTPRLLPTRLSSRPSSRRPRHRPPLRVAASRPPASLRSPRPPPWSRRLLLPVSVCHLRLHRRLPRSWPRSSSPPPLRPTKIRSSPDFTFRRLHCSMSASW